MKNSLGIFFICLFLSSFCLQGISQTSWKGIKGTVLEQQDTTDLSVENAVVRLLNPKDSSLVKVTSTDKKGVFSFPSVAKNDYLLSVTFIGFNTFYKNITPVAYSGEVADMGTIWMEESSVQLSEVTVIAEIPEVVIKEDTLEYNPDAFRMQGSATVEDLLKRLPGIEVDVDGKITTPQGKQVRRVFVDGKEFFGNDPKMATKNITLDIVDKVQVIEKKSDQEILTGVEDGEEETIINLTIKKGMKKGWLSNTSAGAGAFVDNKTDNDPRYAGNIFVSRFFENNQITLLGNTNNVNNQGFEDVRGSGRGGGGGGGNGITNSSSAGLNLTGIVNDKLKMGGNIRYGYSDALVNRKSFRQNILADSVTYRESRSDNHDYSNNLVFDYKAEFTPDTLNTWVLTANASYNHSRSSDYSFQSTMAGDEDSTRVNLSDTRRHTQEDGLSLSMDLAYSRKFSKKGRRFNINGIFNANRNSEGGNNISDNEFYLNPSKNQKLNQELNNQSSRNSYVLRVSYVEPVWKTNNTLQFSYNLRYNRTKNSRETYDYDPDTETYSLLNPDYSKNMWNNYLNQTFGMSFNAVHTDYSYNIGMNVVPSFTQSSSMSYQGKNHTLVVDTVMKCFPLRKVVNYSPQLSFTYRFSRESNMRFTYRGNTSQPSVTQLDPTPINTNPLSIRSGNPELLPSFSHDISLRYSNNQRVSQRSLTSNLSFSFVQDQIINFTSYEENTGIQHTMPINENGSWNTLGDVLYNIPLGEKKKFRLSAQSRINYNNQVGYVRVGKQSERNIAGTLGLSEILGLSYSKDWYYGQFRGNIRYSKTTNVLKGRDDQVNTNFGLTYNTQIYFPYSWVLASDVNYRARRGLSAGYNTDEVVWNAELSKQFLNNKAAVRLKWTDILQQALNISRTIDNNYIEDNEYNRLSSYFLVTFSYRLNQMGGRRSSGESRSNRESFDRGGRSDRGGESRRGGNRN